MSPATLDHDALEERLRTTFTAVMPLLDDVDGATPVHDTVSVRHRWVAAASVAVVSAGAVGTIAVRSANDPAPLESATTLPTTTTVATTATSTTTPSGLDTGMISVPMGDGPETPNPWDPIRIAPGTVGWYDIDPDELGPAVAAELGEREAWTPDYISVFYRCVGWAEDRDGPICNQLATGGREFVNYGNEAVGLGIGTNLVAHDPRELLWSLAAGSLWGYDTMTEPPEPGTVRIGDTSGIQYRNGDASYLLWEQQPGQYVWFFSHGLDNESLAALATTVRSVELPERMPVLISLDDETNVVEPHDDFVESIDRLLLGWLDGRPCVAFGVSGVDQCTPVDAGPVLVVDGSPAGVNPSVAVVGPDEEDLLVEVDLFELGTEPVERTSEVLGLASYVFRPGSERILGTHVRGADGETVAEVAFDLTDFVNGFPPDPIVEGRTTGIAWVVVRQDPAAGGANATYLDGTQYCWLLVGVEQWAPLCLDGAPPVTGLGRDADFHDDITLIEVAPDVVSAACGDEDLPIYTDEQRDGRRFIVSPCDYEAVIVATS